MCEVLVRSNKYLNSKFYNAFNGDSINNKIIKNLFFKLDLEKVSHEFYLLTREFICEIRVGTLYLSSS